MKINNMSVCFTLILTGGLAFFVLAEENHKSDADDMNIGFSMSENDPAHEADKQVAHAHDHNENVTKSSSEARHDDHGTDHGTDAGHDEHEEDGAALNEAQLKSAGIFVETLFPQSISNTISAPGEVLFNAYQSKKITPRISAQVIKRHKYLGDTVKKGQVLVSLSSVEMAEAQGGLIVADQEWQRVKKLGKKVVSERRFVQTQITRQQAFAKVLAFGMTTSQVSVLLKANDPSEAVGRFNLLATRSGTITEDKFVEGEIIEPGRVLFEITDESSMWVEAKLTPNTIHGVTVGANATISAGQVRYPAKVTQIHHQLDEATRTIAVRLEVANEEDELHPGLFVQALIQITGNQQALALPTSAVLRSPDGDWTIFVEEAPGKFKPQDVEVKGNTGELIIIDGVPSGTRVVTKGAFFVQSEIAKSGFEVHNH